MNVAGTLEARAAANPAQIALHDPIGRAAGRTRYDAVTYATLASDVRRAAQSLLDTGIEAGDRVAMMVPPSRAFFTLTFALFRAGAVPVFIDPGMGMRNVKRCLAEAAPTAFIGTTKAHLARILFGWERGNLHQILRPHTLPKAQEDAPLYEPTPHETAALLFTSGSTGAPKGAVYQHAHFLAQIDLLRRTYGIEAGEHDLCTFPLFALFAPALGLTAVIPEMDFTRPARVDPRKIFAAIERFQVSNLFGSPALLRRVATAGVAQGVKLPSLRRVLSAGAPVPAKTLARFAQLLTGEAQIFTPYGATEALPVASIGHREVVGETALATARGAGICVGRPVAGTTVKILTISDEAIPLLTPDWELPAGVIGEISVQGPQVTAAYFSRPDADFLAKTIDFTTKALVHRMGDLGYFDDQGRLWFCGRKSHRVATAAGELYTIPCEAVFNQHALVHRTALVGRGAAPMTPVLCVEAERPLKRRERRVVEQELLALGRTHPDTRNIATIRFFKTLPVDTRHNAKIFREKLKSAIDREAPQ